jgi:hypothetical protein
MSFVIYVALILKITELYFNLFVKGHQYPSQPGVYSGDGIAMYMGFLIGPVLSLLLAHITNKLLFRQKKITIGIIITIEVIAFSYIIYFIAYS